MRVGRVLVAVLSLVAIWGPGGVRRGPQANQDGSSERMLAFERDYAVRGQAAVSDLRAELTASGTPVVEPIAGDSSRVRVTFVWLASRPRQNVVVQSWLASRDVQRRALRQVGDSGVWYRSFEAPAGLTMGYLMSPDDLRLIEGADADFDQVTDTWVTDPLNPRTATGALGIDWSVIDLTVDDTSRWLRSGPEVPDARLDRMTVDSEALDAPIDVTVYMPPGFDAGTIDYPLLLFFDGYGFFEIDQAHRLVEQLIVRGELAPIVVAFIFNPDATRNRDMSCYAPMHQFLRNELLPELREEFRAGRQAGRTVLAGRSRSGLGAACAAWEMPDQFGGVISQSGSFWWAPDGAEPEWLARQVATSARKPLDVYLDAGLLEAEPNPETGLSMLTVTRHMRDVLGARGYPVMYQEFAGGHDPIGWRTTLPAALRHFFSR